MSHPYDVFGKASISPVEVIALRKRVGGKHKINLCGLPCNLQDWSLSGLRMTLRPRLYLLDTFRGLASLSVVIWHYQHFYFDNHGKLSANFILEAQPFYSSLQWFYRHGSEAVQLFFAISGFIFFLTCHTAISTQKMSGWRFAALRFSRLYPLHVVTLLFVALAQTLSYRLDGHHIVYQHNDGWHFFAQLFFASHWGFQGGQSFNGPIWSVSVEIILYALFFGLSRYLGAVTRKTIIAVLVMFCLSGLLQFFPGIRFLSIPTACFFAGGISYAIWDAIQLATPRTKIHVAGGAAVVSLTSLWCYTYGGSIDGAPTSQLLYFVAFPSSILFLALLQDALPNLGRRTRVIGDITYATYLIHFPIQITILLAAKYYELNIDFQSPIMFLLFFALVISISIPTYHYFELPMQQLCRRKLLGESPSLGARDDAPLFCRRRSWGWGWGSRPPADRRRADPAT
jgi:peptidoglycan/LPS O-acetylase OafA/YrhL